jgi:hypothetical protein
LTLATNQPRAAFDERQVQVHRLMHNGFSQSKVADRRRWRQGHEDQVWPPWLAMANVVPLIRGIQNEHLSDAIQNDSLK